MNKPKTLTIILAAILIVSISTNLYLTHLNAILSSQNSVYEAKVDMIATLAEIRVGTDTEIKRIGESLIYAAEQLSTSGLTGMQADAILNALTANSYSL